MTDRTAYEAEHEDDMPDHADAFALLDDGIIRASRCPHCCNFICTCEDDFGLDGMAERALLRRARTREMNAKRWQS